MASDTTDKGFIPSAELLAEVYGKSQASSYGLSQSEFGEILSAIVAKYVIDIGTSGKAPSDFFRSLKLEDLGLARGCARGNEKAWEVFLTRFREKLFDSARQITREESSARELADSIYAELYGTVTRDGARVSKLNSYTARGSLEGWLRTVLAQEWVNRYRKNKRLVSLDEKIEDGAQFSAVGQEDAREIKSPLIAATDRALGALAAEDRYILASYFIDKRTLAEVARTLGVHESTISRKVEKLVKTVRKQIVDGLVGGGMSRRQAEEAMEVDVRDLSVNVSSALKQQKPVNSSQLAGEMMQEPAKKAFQAIEGKKE